MSTPLSKLLVGSSAPPCAPPPFAFSSLIEMYSLFGHVMRNPAAIQEAVGGATATVGAGTAAPAPVLHVYTQQP